MSGRIRLGLLFGGRSVEHEVSVRSARAVEASLTGTDFECIPIAMTGDGRWLSPAVSRVLLAGDGRRAEPTAAEDDGARLVLDPGAGRLLALFPGAEPQPLALDFVFPLIHGWGGEDGRIQGAFELVGIPYVGSGVLGSAVAMDKAVARQLFEAHGLPGPRWLTLNHSPSGHGQAERRQIGTEIGFPLFVKPANGGSSVGVSRVATEDQLAAALDKAFACDVKILVEQGLDAREIECAVLGNDRPRASVLGEVVPSNEFYDYAAKYLDGRSELKIPADLDAETTRTIRAHALTAFGCLGLSGLARVDFLVERRSGQVFLNEVNTLPGFTSISMFPKLWEATGLPFSGLIERLVELAQERWRTERSLRTSWNCTD